VLIHGGLGIVELIANELGDPETDWFMQEYGGGVMILGRVSGRTFIPTDQLPDDENLEFVSRTKPPNRVPCPRMRPLVRLERLR
jgi:hypothetical protein